MQTLFDIPLTMIDGRPMNWASTHGRKILLVNTASECGYTPQYAQLQELHQHYGEKLLVIGLPCNDFGSQEPGDASAILTFCQKNYGVTFPLSEKINIISQPIHPIYLFLTRQELNGHSNSEVTWNFQKYLLDENGKLLQVFAPGTSVMSEEFLNAL